MRSPGKAVVPSHSQPTPGPEDAAGTLGSCFQRFFVAVDDPESVRLYGITSSPDEKQLVEKTVKRIKDAKRVINDVAVFSGALNGV